MKLSARIRGFVSAIWVVLVVALGVGDLAAQNAPVSYYNDIRPIIQASCQGCHHPGAKMSGLVLTEYGGILQGGQRHGPALRAGEVDQSPILGYLTGKMEPRMPMGGGPLPDEQIALIRRWIEQGAADDTPESAKGPQIPTEPPVYQQPPVVNAIAYSPDGALLAVGGYKEILLLKADGSGIEARLLGKSDRILSLGFTPDGKTLVAVGGTPARLGEVQIWDVASREMKRSVTSTNDTLFGGSISPDGKYVAFGAADNALRAIEIETGKELFKAGHHEDWVLGAVYGTDGKRIVSVGRDRAAKLADASSGAFLENVNLLRDILYAIARHPRRDYVLIGGEDRIPYLYTMDRSRALKIADDSTLVRKFEEQQGRIMALAFSPDGSRIAVGGLGAEIPIYNTETGERVATCAGDESGVFVLRFRPDGKQLAAAGFDGHVRFYDPASGKLAKEFVPVPLQESKTSE
jgi:WD40 repeat protein/mono/diheme cytochrome c family protein